ncbi:MAG: carbon-nitrogen family hydrolase [bacterium]|nr:carbon-nitrogen family hydrolase [bacterium]
MNVLCVQLDIAWSDPQTNCQAVSDMLSSVDIQHGDLVVLPEMFATGFSMDAAAISQPPEGAISMFMSETAQQLGVYLLGGLAVRYDETFRNEAILFGPDGSVSSRYWKTHPFSPSSEAMHYTPGDQVVVIPLGEFRMQPGICYDLRFGEMFRPTASGGANLIAVIANWPADRCEHWTCLLRARAIENQAYVVGVNRCGSDPNHTYAGGSTIIDPQGNVLAAAGSDQCVISAEIDIDAINRWREQFPALNDIRRDLKYPG